MRIDRATHLDQYRAMPAAVGATCDRCGTFAETAPYWGRMFCGECIERLSARPLTLHSLHEAFWGMFKRVGGWVIGLHALSHLPITLLALAGESGLASDLLGWFLPVFVGALCAHIAVRQAVSGGPVRLAEAAAAVRERFLLLTLSSGAAVVISLLFAFLVIIPGVMRLLSYALVTTIAVCDPVVEPLDVLQRSQARMKGHRWVALAAYVCAYAAASGPSVLLMTILAGLDLGGAGRFLPAFAGGVGGALGGIVTLVSAALYVELTRPDLWPVASPVGSASE